MSEEKIRLECYEYERLRKVEIKREELLGNFSGMEKTFKDNSLNKVFSLIEEAIKTEDTLRWYENYNGGTCNAIAIIHEEGHKEEINSVIAVPGSERMIAHFFKEYLSPPIKYIYWRTNDEGDKVETSLEKTLMLEDVYQYFYSMSKLFGDNNKYSRYMLEKLPDVSVFEYHEKNRELKFVEGNVTISVEVSEENNIFIDTLRKLAL